MAIHPTYWLSFRTTDAVVNNLIVCLGFQGAELSTVAGLWYDSAPRWWGPRDPAAARFWRSENEGIVRLLCVDPSTDTIYVRCVNP